MGVISPFEHPGLDRDLQLPDQRSLLELQRSAVRIAEGNPEFGFPATDGAGMANSGRAFFADGWFDPESKKWNGMGVSFWDVEAENGEKFAVHDVRLALGLSYANIMDPSPKAVAKAEKKGPTKCGECHK